MNVTATSPTTVLPRPPHLSLQPYYVDAVAPFAPNEAPMLASDMPYEWRLSFGRSPQCTSLAQAYSKGQINIFEVRGAQYGHTNKLPVNDERWCRACQCPVFYVTSRSPREFD